MAKTSKTLYYQRQAQISNSFKLARICNPCLTLTHKTLLILFLFLQLSCEQEYSWKLQQSNIQTLVVDGIITNENKTQSIKLSLVNSEINKPSVPLSAAGVSVSDSITNYFFTESVSEPGSYFSAPFQAVVGKTYTLNVKYQTKVFSATATMVPISKSGAISTYWDDSKQLFKFVPEATSEPIMIKTSYDWISNPEYTSKYGNNKAGETFYFLNNVDASKIFAPEKEIIYFPAGTKIVRRQYSLSTNHQAFLRSLLMETEWRGGVFDVQQGNVSTNISNGGLGFFGACMVISDSLLVK